MGDGGEHGKAVRQQGVRVPRRDGATRQRKKPRQQRPAHPELVRRYGPTSNSHEAHPSRTVQFRGRMKASGVVFPQCRMNVVAGEERHVCCMRSSVWRCMRGAGICRRMCRSMMPPSPRPLSRLRSCLPSVAQLRTRRNVLRGQRGIEARGGCACESSSPLVSANHAGMPTQQRQEGRNLRALVCASTPSVVRWREGKGGRDGEQDKQNAHARCRPTAGVKKMPAR